MAINEVFPNSTVKSVHFQVTYPSLFYIEKKIGDFQLKIMKRFPDSQQVFHRQILITDVGADKSMAPLPPETEPAGITTIWSFKSGKGVTVDVRSQSLSIHSTAHKTYNNPDADNRFRDTIAFVVDAFLEVTLIPAITRVGLRYMDECPILEKTNESFRHYYNSVFPLERFPLVDAVEMSYRSVVKRGNCFLIYAETLASDKNDKPQLKLDFDAFARDVEPGKYLATADELHTVISNEFEATIKQPVYEYMRTPQGNVSC